MRTQSPTGYIIIKLTMALALCFNLSCSDNEQTDGTKTENAIGIVASATVTNIQRQDFPNANKIEFVNTNQTSIRESKANLDEDIIEAVRAWYKAKHLTAPSQILISERSAKYWRIIASPGSNGEMVFHVDPNTKSILLAVGE